MGLLACLLTSAKANAQTYRLWNGSNTTGQSNYWYTIIPENWTPADVPDTAGEAVDIDGDANGTTNILMVYPNFTIGQFRVRAPTTTTYFWNDTGVSGAYTLTLSPAASFGGIGLDMSSATVDFTIKTANSAKYLVIALASNQQWNINSVSADGDLIFGPALSDQFPKPTTIELGGHKLTNNVGTGRTLDATYALFQGTGGNLVKTGAGTMILGQTNTYTGGTTILGGTLAASTICLTNNSQRLTVHDGALTMVTLEGELKKDGGDGTVDMYPGAELAVRGGSADTDTLEEFYALTGGIVGFNGDDMRFRDHSNWINFGDMAGSLWYSVKYDSDYHGSGQGYTVLKTFENIVATVITVQ